MPLPPKFARTWLQQYSLSPSPPQTHHRPLNAPRSLLPRKQTSCRSLLHLRSAKLLTCLHFSIHCSVARTPWPTNPWNWDTITSSWPDTLPGFNPGAPRGFRGDAALRSSYFPASFLPFLEHSLSVAVLPCSPQSTLHRPSPTGHFHSAVPTTRWGPPDLWFCPRASHAFLPYKQIETWNKVHSLESMAYEVLLGMA